MHNASGLTVISFSKQDEKRIDITALNRADIKARDWSAVHIAADRRAPVDLAEPVKRTWL
jgi:hypothetical protein